MGAIESGKEEPGGVEWGGVADALADPFPGGAIPLRLRDPNVRRHSEGPAMSMISFETRTVLVSLAVTRLSSHPEVPTEAPCLGCGSSLQLHQPDGDAPQRLLGTCDICGRWHLIDCDECVVVLLPDATEI